MFKRLSYFIGVSAVVSGLLAIPTPAAAIMIGFDPQDQTVLLGDQATVNVVVDPMGSFVGAFDVIVTWDDSIIDLASVTVDPFDQFGETFDDTVPIGTDALNVASVSLQGLVFPEPLSDFQDGNTPITLFSITFDTLAAGTSTLTLMPNIGPGLGFLGDEFGFLLAVPDPLDGSITVLDPTLIPAPGTLLLLAIGLIGLGVARRGRVAPRT